MVFDSTQFIIDVQKNKRSPDVNGDIENLIPIEKNVQGDWVDAPVQTGGTGDLTNAVPVDHVNINITGSDEPVLVPKNATEVPTDLTEYLTEKYKAGKHPLTYGAIGELHARGEIGFEEAMELSDKELLKDLERQDRLDIMKAQQSKIGVILGGASQFLPYMIDSTIEAAKNAVMFGTGGALTAILTGGATTPLIPGLMAAGGTYGVIKNSIDVEGMGIYLDLMKKGMPPETALPLSVAAGTAIGITEVYSLKLFGAGFKRKVAEAVMSKLGKRALLNMVAFHVKSTGLQVGQEFVQETVEIATKFLASIIDDNPSIMPTLEEMSATFTDLASLETVGGLGLLSAPGAVGVGIRTRALNTKQAMAEVKKTLDEQKVKAAEEVELEVTEEAIGEAVGEEIITEEEQLQKAVGEVLALEAEAEAAAQVDEEGNQGSTFSADGTENLIGTPNIAVSIFPDLTRKVEGRLTEETAVEEIGAFREEHAEMLAGNPELAVGTFYSEDTDTTFIDIASIVPEEQIDAAKALGKEFNQISVFNLRTFEEIATGGTGEAVSADVSIQDRIDRMKELVGVEPLEPSKPTPIKKVVKRKDIKGRINKLSSERKEINKEIEALGKQFTKGKLTEVQLETKLEKQFDKLIKLEDELVPLQLLEDITDIDLGARKVELRADEVRALQTAIVKEKAVALERGIKEGKRIQRAEILEVQNAITAIVMASEATEAAKRNALKAMRKIQTEEQFKKALPGLITKLERAEEGLKKKLLIEKFKKLTKAKAVRELRPEIKSQVDAILNEFTAVKPSEKRVLKIQKAIEALKESPNNQISDEQLLHLSGLDRKPLRDMSLDDVKFVHDAVSHLIWLNTEANKAVEAERTAQDQKNVEEAVGNLERRFKVLEGSVEGLDSLQKLEEKKLLGLNLGGVGDIAGVGSYRMELIGEILDGQDKGIIQRIMYEEIDRGEAKSLKFKHDAEDYFIRNGLRNILKDDSYSEFFTKKVKEKDKIDIRLDSGKTVRVSKGTRIAFLLHARNENSRRHLLKGGFVTQRHPFATPKKMTEADLVRIQGAATFGEHRIAEVIHTYFNVIQKQAGNEVSVDLLGFELLTEPDYFPINVSGQALEKEVKIKDLSGSDNFIKETLEGMGIFKKRVKSNAPIVITDAFEVTHHNMQKMSAYIGLAKPLRTAKSLLHAPKFKAALENAGLGKYRQSMEDYLGRVESDSMRNDAFDKLTQNWINRLDVAILGGNVGVFFKQPVSYFLAATEMDMKYIATSFKPKASKALIAEIMKWNPHFRDRFEGNVTRELGEVASVGRTRRFFTGRELISNKLMIGIKTFDKMAIASIWRAVRKEVAAKHPSLKVGSPEYFQKVSDRAWEVARRTQPTFAIKDRSTIGRKQNTFWRLATKYSSQRNKNWQIQRHAIEQWNRSEKTFADFRLVAKRLILIRFIAPAMIAGVNAIRGLGRDDVNDEENGLLKKFVADWLKTTLGDVYLISGIIQEAIGKIEGGQGFGMTDPLTANWEKMGKLMSDVIKEFNLVIGITKVKSRRDWEKKQEKIIWELIKDTSDVSSKVSGIPFESARRSLELGGKAVGIIPKKEDKNKAKFHRY